MCGVEKGGIGRVSRPADRVWAPETLDAKAGKWEQRGAKAFGSMYVRQMGMGGRMRACACKSRPAKGAVDLKQPAHLNQSQPMHLEIDRPIDRPTDSIRGTPIRQWIRSGGFVGLGGAQPINHTQHPQSPYLGRVVASQEERRGLARSLAFFSPAAGSFVPHTPKTAMCAPWGVDRIDASIK